MYMSFTFLAASTFPDPSINNTNPKMGWAIGGAILVGVILFGLLVYIYSDYRKHKKPLVEADPIANQTYTLSHHISTVSIPLLRYRLSISLHRKPTGISKF